MKHFTSTDSVCDEISGWSIETSLSRNLWNTVVWDNQNMPHVIEVYPDKKQALEGHQNWCSRLMNPPSVLYDARMHEWFHLN